MKGENLNMKDLQITTRLTNELFNDEKISNEDLVTYTMMLKNVVWRDVGEQEIYAIVNINNITLRLTQSIENKNNKRWHTTIKESLKSLIELKLIYGVYDIFQNEINVDDIDPYQCFYIKAEYIEGDYFMVNQSEIDRLLAEIKSTKISKFQIVRYYIATQRVVNTKERFGYLAQRYITFINNFSTINQYNDILNNNFCLINNDYVSQQKQWQTTFFGQIGDEENFNLQIQSIVGSNKLVKVNKEKVKKKISNTQKANHKAKKNEVAELKAEIERLKKQSNAENVLPRKKYDILSDLPDYIQEKQTYKMTFDPLTEKELEDLFS